MLYNIDIRHSTRYLSTILPRCGFSVIFLSNTAAGCLQSFFLFFSIYITRTRYRQVFFYGEFFLPEKRKICFLVLSMLIPHARHCLFACSPVLSPLCVAYAIRCTRLMLSPPPAIWCKLLTYRSRILRKNSYSLESFFFVISKFRCIFLFWSIWSDGFLFCATQGSSWYQAAQQPDAFAASLELQPTNRAIVIDSAAATTSAVRNSSRSSNQCSGQSQRTESRCPSALDALLDDLKNYSETNRPVRDQLCFI